MIVKAKKDRELILIRAQNTQNENKAEIIEINVPEEYESFNKKIVFITDDGTVWDVIQNNEYKITNAITKYKQVDFYIWLTKEVNGESIDFRSKTKTLKFYDNIDASDEITPEEIHGVNTVVNILEDEIDKVENLNITAQKVGKQTTITITKKDGTTQQTIINDGADGQNGKDGKDGKDGDDYVITQQDYQNIANIVEQQVDIPTALSQLTDDSTHRTVTDTEKTTWNSKGTYTKPENGIPKTDMTSAVQTSLGKADTAIQDISMKQNIEDNTLTTTNKTVPSAINEVNSIAKGANQAVSYASYQAMVTAFNSLDDDVYNIGQNIYIVTTEVPDLWISSVESTSSTYIYVDDATIISALQTNGYIQVGYYKLSMLETQKVDLTNYVTNTDYATVSKAGILKVGNGFTLDSSTKALKATMYTYTGYNNAQNHVPISKGTLENVITGKELVNKTYVDNIVGDIESLLAEV